MKPGIILGVATAIVIGIVATGTGGGGGGGALANLWVDTNGGTCTRSATPVAYVDAAACASFDNAYDAASCSDTVLVKAGSYGTQNMSGSLSCSGWSSTACTGCVAFGEATGETVSIGSSDVTASYLTLTGITTGSIVFQTAANHFILDGDVNTPGTVFDVFGADYITIQNGTFDGNFVANQNLIWDRPAGNTASNLLIKNNLIKNYYINDDGVTHSEGLYVGYSDHGVIDGNTFTDNGNTAHIFFTWFGELGSPPASNPHDWCVRNNTFNHTYAFYDVQFRDEINPVTSNIVVQSSASIDDVTARGTC